MVETQINNTMTINKNSWSFIAISEVKSYTREEAIARASEYGLQEEVTYLMNHGYSPNEALAEWDCL